MLSASVLVRWASHVTVRLAAAWQRSRLRGVVVGQVARWRRSSPVAAAANGAKVLIVATIVHLGLSLASHRPAGWLWLVVPAMAGASAAVLFLASRRSSGASS